MSETLRVVVGDGFGGLRRGRPLVRHFAEHAAITAHAFPSFLRFADGEQVACSFVSVFRKKDRVPKKVEQ